MFIFDYVENACIEKQSQLTNEDKIKVKEKVKN